MNLPPTYEVVALPAEMRAIARRGEWRGSTGGQCPAYQQANLVILPKEVAAEFSVPVPPTPFAGTRRDFVGCPYRSKGAILTVRLAEIRRKSVKIRHQPCFVY